MRINPRTKKLPIPFLPSVFGILLIAATTSTALSLTSPYHRDGTPVAPQQTNSEAKSEPLASSYTRIEVAPPPPIAEITTESTPEIPVAQSTSQTNQTANNTPSSSSVKRNGIIPALVTPVTSLTDILLGNLFRAK